MAKLNQIIAVVNGKKTETQKALTEVYRKCEKSELFSGLSRSYTPKNEEGEQLPPEGKKLQYSVGEAVKDFTSSLSGLFDIVFTQEVANTRAKSDIIVDGVTLVKDVPVSYLLFLEKQLVDINTFVSKLPTLDPSETWSFDENQDAYVSVPSFSNRTQKTLMHKVVYEATPEHPAQVQTWNEDIVVGQWKTIKFSGSMPAKQKKDMVEKVKKLQDAVKFAREQANLVDVSNENISEKIANYLFA